MAQANKQGFGKRLGNLVGLSLESGYVPTLLGAEQQELADAFDEAMSMLGRPQRAWRGSPQRAA